MLRCIEDYLRPFRGLIEEPEDYKRRLLQDDLIE